MVKSSSLICATIVLGANTPAAKRALPNSVPAAYSETSDGIVLMFRKFLRSLDGLSQIVERKQPRAGSL